MDALRKLANQATIAEAVDITGIPRKYIEYAINRGIIPSRLTNQRSKRRSIRYVDLEEIDALHGTRWTGAKDRGDAMVAEVLAGTSLETVAKKYGVKIYTVRKMMNRRGWKAKSEGRYRVPPVFKKATG